MKESVPAFTRRRFLGASVAAGATVAAAACSPAGSQSPASAPQVPVPVVAKPAWEGQWEDLTAAAKKEGRVVINAIRSQSGARAALDEFQKLFGVEAEFTLFSASTEWEQKVLSEQKANVFTWDLSVSAGSAFDTLKPVGAIQPIRPLMMRPDVLDDKLWTGGFDAGWYDSEKQWAYAFLEELGFGFYINTEMVNPGELKSINDLLNPKWKGQVLWADPKISGFGYGTGSVIRRNLGESVLKKLWVDQEPVYSRDTRQIAEFMVRGRYPIGLGVPVPTLKEFLGQGLGKSLKEIQLKESCYTRTGLPIFYMAKAPHPNAAKLLLNWLLTKEGQVAWATGIDTNTRRTDVPVISKDREITAEWKDCIRFHGEAINVMHNETRALAAEWLK